MEELVGRPLTDVDGLDFEVQVTAEGGTSRLTLTTRAGTGPTSQRVLTGQTCVEVTDAAALAMAMAIREAKPADPTPATDDVPATAPPISASPPQPVVVKDAPSTPPPNEDQPPVQGFLGLAPVLDTAALPEPTLGILVGGGVRWNWLRVEAQGEAFAPQRVTLPEGRSGEFGLLALALLGCVDPSATTVAVLGCGGLELGRLSGEGRGVTDPELGTSLWVAARAEGAVAIRLGSAVRLMPRLGVAVPFERPEFVLDGTPVHRPGALSVRAALGVEFTL